MAASVTSADASATPSSEAPAWSASHVSIADVVDAAERLRRSEQRAASRTSIATLVIVTRNTDQLDDAQTVIDHLGVRHPARIITLLAPEDAYQEADRVDADVILHAGEAAGHPIWSDEIRLRVSGGPARHPASLLRPLQLSDLPALVWYLRDLPNDRDPLLKMASVVIIDSKSASDLGDSERAMHETFAEIASLARKHALVDLSWSRLAMWRSLLATQFQGEFAPMVGAIKGAQISGKLAPRTLLAGWLSSQLSLPREAMQLYDSRHVSIKLFAELNGSKAEFAVERTSEGRFVRASASIEDGPSTNELLALPSDTLPLSLEWALRNAERDRIYEMAVKTIQGWTR